MKNAGIMNAVSLLVLGVCIIIGVAEAKTTSRKFASDGTCQKWFKGKVESVSLGVLKDNDTTDKATVFIRNIRKPGGEKLKQPSLIEFYIDRGKNKMDDQFLDYFRSALVANLMVDVTIKMKASYCANKTPEEVNEDHSISPLDVQKILHVSINRLMVVDGQVILDD